MNRRSSRRFAPALEGSLTPQLSLDLKERMPHGGARPGAGRPRKKDSERGFIAHHARPSLRKDHPVHVTLRAMRNVPSLRSDLLERIVKRALVAQRDAMAEKGAKSFQLVDFTVQGDHLHLIVEATDKRALARGVAGLEVRVARRINRALKRKGSLWNGRYHRHDLRTPTEVRNALRYVLLNSQKHRRVIGDRAFADPHSSANSFDGFVRPPAIFDELVPWPPVLPRTWLRRAGWRRLGLLDPADAPARARTPTSRAVSRDPSW